MNHDDVRDIFARTLSAPPVPRQGTDEIVTAGRRLERRRQTLTLGGMVTAIAAGVVGIGLVLQQGGPGSGAPGFDGASPSAAPVAGWNPSGEPDPGGRYAEAIWETVGVVAGEWGGHATLNHFAWTPDRTAIATNLYAEDMYPGNGLEDTVRMDVTIQEPRPGADVDQRMEALAECDDDCELTTTADGRRLLTRQDRFVPKTKDDYGYDQGASRVERTRFRVMVARADGTIATIATWDMDGDSMPWTLKQPTAIVTALPEITAASGSPSASPGESDNGGTPDAPADPDGALLTAVQELVAVYTVGAELSALPGEELAFEWGAAEGVKELRAMLTFPDGGRYRLSIDIASFRVAVPAEDRAQLEAVGKCDVGDNDCSFEVMQPDDMVLSKVSRVEGGGGTVTLHEAWATREDDSYAGLRIEPFEGNEATQPPMPLDTMVAMVAGIPLTGLPVEN